MKPDASVLERIDVRWAVRTRVEFDTVRGTATATASFLMTLGTYDGPMTKEMMADNISSRGIHEGDVDDVQCDGGAPSIRETETILAGRGIRPDDIVEMVVRDVILDDAHEIASSVLEDEEQSDMPFATGGIR